MSSLIGSKLTDEVVWRYAGCTDVRLKEIMVSLVRHLHSFTRDVKLTEDEWIKGIKFLTDVGHFTTEMRDEFILLSDVLGLSMTVVNHGAAAGDTEATIQGPVYVPGLPEPPIGTTVVGNPPGDPHVDEDAVFGVKQFPIQEFKRAPDGKSYSLNYDFVLSPGA